MHWLSRERYLLSQLDQLQVDCSQCQTLSFDNRDTPKDFNSKCCDYRPFVSGFSLGAELEARSDFALPAGSDIIYSVLGIIQLYPHDKSLPVCSFFQKGQCRIWQQRPPVCRNYLCVQLDAAQQAKRDQIEAQLFKRESVILNRWFVEHGFSPTQWEEFTTLMESPPLSARLSHGLLLEPAQALTHYHQMYQWVRQSLDF